MIKYRTVLIINCDWDLCGLSQRFEDSDKLGANRQAAAAGWVVNIQTGRLLCPDHVAALTLNQNSLAPVSAAEDK